MIIMGDGILWVMQIEKKYLTEHYDHHGDAWTTRALDGVTGWAFWAMVKLFRSQGSAHGFRGDRTGKRGDYRYRLYKADSKKSLDV